MFIFPTFIIGTSRNFIFTWKFKFSLENLILLPVLILNSQKYTLRNFVNNLVYRINVGSTELELVPEALFFPAPQYW